MSRHFTHFNVYLLTYLVCHFQVGSIWLPYIKRARFAIDVKMANLIICLSWRHTFNLPFFAAPVVNMGLAHPRSELNLVEAAGKGGIPHLPSLPATQSMEEIARHARPGQVLFNQLYTSANCCRTSGGSRPAAQRPFS